MAEYIFSVGTKAGGDDLVRISSVSGSTPSYTLTLTASVPATVLKGDKIVDSNSKTYLITGPTAGGATDRTITPGTSLTVDKTPLSIAPFNSTVDPTPNSGVDVHITRAFSKFNVSGATDGTTGSFERGTRGALTNAYTGELWESISQNTNLGIFSATSATASNFRKITNAPGFRMRDQSGIASQAIRIGVLSLPVVTVTAVGSAGWFKPSENYCQLTDLILDLQNVGASFDNAMLNDAGNGFTTVRDCVIGIAFSGTGKTALSFNNGGLQFFKNFVYVYGSSGTQLIFVNASTLNNNIHENTFLGCTDVSGSPLFTTGLSFGSQINCVFTNNAFLVPCSAGGAFVNTAGAGTIIDYNTYVASANDADHIGTHFKRIDNSTSGQLISDLLRGVTISTVDGRPQNNSNIVASGNGATGTTNTTDLIGQTYVSGTGRSTGAIEFALATGGALHYLMRRWHD